MNAPNFKDLTISNSEYPWYRRLQWKLKKFIVDLVLGKERCYIVGVVLEEEFKILAVAYGDSADAALNSADDKFKIVWNAARLGKSNLSIFVCVERWRININ